MADAPPAYAWVVLILLTMLSGVFSGLNLGLMSLTVEDLNIVINSSEDEKEVRNAKQILPLRRHGNLLLCTLLIGNTLVNVMLAVVTDPIWVFLFGTGTAGVILALVLPSSLIVVCGEIVPQSLCSRYALTIGAKTLPITYVFVVVTFVLAFPISKVLDRLLGEEMGAVYSRRGLVQLIKLNAQDLRAEQSGLTKEDEKILIGALSFQDRTVGEVMTSIDQVFSLPHEAVLDRETFLDILQRGHTRIPVYDGEPGNIVNILLAKSLLGIGYERKMPLKTALQDFHAGGSDIHLRRIHKATKCDVALKVCKRERLHMFIVTEEAAPAKDGNGSDPVDGMGPAIGIVTVEDFIEEILQDELVDETDEYVQYAPPSTPTSLKRLNTKRYDAAVVLRKLPTVPSI